MAGRSVDVSLVIKAVDQSKSALDTVAKSLEAITNAQKAVASGSGDTSKALDNLLKEVGNLGDVFKGLTANADRVEEAYRRQADALARTTASIETRKQKIAELKAVEASYQQQLAKGFVGPTLPDVTRDNLRGVRRELRSQDRGLTTDIASQTSLLEKLRQSREATLAIKDAQSQVASATKIAGSEYDRLALAAQKAAQASDAAAAAAEKVAIAQQRAASLRGRIDTATGVSRPAAVDNGATFEALAAREEAAMKSLQQYAQNVAESLDPAVRMTRLLAEEQERLTAAVKAGALTSDQANARMKAYRAELEGEAAAAKKASRETEALTTYVQELRRSFDPAAYATRFLATETAKLDLALKKGILSQQEYAKALEVVKKRTEQLGEKQNVRLFGLEPYQTQNLLMQFNDIGTQLASGTSLTQTLAQQGGQIIQLFPQVGNAIVGAMSVGTAAIAGVAVAIGTVLAKAFDLQATFRDFDGAIAASGNSVAATSQQLVAAAEAIDRYGLSAEEANTIAKKLFREGFNGEQIRAFGTLAKDMADVLGIDIKQALDLLQEAYTGNYDSLSRLIDQTDAFTPAQRAQIRDLYDQGKAAEATSLAFGILSDKMGKGAELARGPWSEAFRNLGNAWGSLIKTLAESRVALAAVDVINTIASAIDSLTGSTDKATEAELRRQGVFSDGMQQRGDGLTQGPNDPLYSFYNSNGQRSAPGKTDRQDAATPEQIATAKAERKALEEKLALEKEITSERDIQSRLAVISAQENRRLGQSVSDAERASLVAAKVAAERVKLEEQLTRYKEQQARAAKSAAQADEQALKGYVARVVRTESGGRADARNPNSSATGVGQFIDSTWLNTFKKEFPAQAKQLSDAAILSLRTNVEVSKALIERYARDNAAILKKAGVGITEANLYLAHFLGPDGAVKVLRANPNASIANVLGGTRGGRAAIAANPTILGGNATAGSVIRFAERRFPGANLGSAEQARLEGENAVQEQINKRIEKQREFNDDLDAEIAKRRQSVQGEKELLGLQGEALLNKQKEQAINDAILAARQKLRDQLNDPQAELTGDQIAAIAESVGASFDNKRNGVIASELQNRVSELLALRDTIQAQIRSELERGNEGVARTLEGQLNTVNSKLLDASRELYDYQVRNAEALGLSAEALDTLKLKQDALVESTRTWSSILGLTGQQIANTFTSTAVNALDQFAQAIANGKDAIGSLWDAFRTFASNFLLQIAQMIQQQIIFNLVSGLLSGITGSVAGPSSAFSSASVGLRAHSGGIIGGAGPQMTAINPAWYANAMRYHSGGIAGLKPGEVPAVLMQGEEVLTRDDPRHIMNGGGGGNVKIVNTFDEADFFSKGADTTAGQKAILNMVRVNSRAFKAALSGG